MKNVKKAHIKKEKELDKLWSLVVRTRDGFRCQYCNVKSTRIQPHHIFARWHKSTRWESKNGICLCNPHHIWSNTFSAHRTPTEFTLWVKEKIGTRRFNYLKKKSDTLPRNPNYSIIEKNLCKELKKLRRDGKGH